MTWLKLKWARFFTLAGWEWKLSSHPGFDFKITFPCGHSECKGSHTLLVRVVERSREALAKSHAKRFSAEQMYTQPHPALFGDGPENTFWQMMHGAGGGIEDVARWVPDARRLWEQAAQD
jgi:hypothetical protein